MNMELPNTVFSSNRNISKHMLYETIFPFCKKSESDVMDDLFVAIQNIVAGTATVSNKLLSETCFQYKIYLSKDFPIITLQYEMKSNSNTELTHTIPVLIDENNKLDNDTIEFSNEIDYDKLEKNTFHFCNIKKEIPEVLCVSDFCEVITDEGMVSNNCSQNNQDDFYPTSSMMEGQKKNLAENKTFRGITKKDGVKNYAERSDLNEEKYSCSYCGKLFKYKSAKKWHEIIHTGEKPFKCEECGMSFTKSSNLTQHKRIHTGEKLFACEECGKTFTQSGSLNKHKRTHRDTELFKCEECGKAFSRSDSLNIHKRIHTRGKPFICEECGKAFTLSRDLNNHKRIHKDERAFCCNDCGKCFSYSRSLNKHKKLHGKLSVVKNVAKLSLNQVT